MNRLEALVALNLVAEIGSVRLAMLLEYFNKPQDIFGASLEKLATVSNIGFKIADKIISVQKKDLDREFSLAKKYGLRIISFEDDDYPRNLRQIPGFPIVLYLKGQILEQDNISIGIVGSRRASIYGLHCAEKFAYDLSDKGLTVISGMARGIDTYAHKGALKRGGRTIAVIGSGFSNIYPPENIGLAEEISKNGAVVSEFPLDALPLPQNFPRRNRVISGLSLGLLVVEAARNSGALITADFALEQGREVFALPGKVDSNTSFGTNELIKQGSKLVSCIDDILEELAVPVANNYKLQENRQVANRACVSYKEDEKILDLITDSAVGLEELIEKTDMNLSQVSSALLRLQLKGLIKQLPGQHFARNQS